jgi:hypothetical protein
MWLCITPPEECDNVLIANDDDADVPVRLTTTISILEGASPASFCYSDDPDGIRSTGIALRCYAVDTCR